MTPQMIAETVEDVSVEWLLANIDVSLDGYNINDSIDFAKMVNHKGKDDQFPILVNRIEQEGFTVPICLNRAHDTAETITLGNGHHRMTAAILMCLDTIKVFWAVGTRFNDSLRRDVTDAEDYAHSDFTDYPEGDYEGIGDLIDL